MCHDGGGFCKMATRVWLARGWLVAGSWLAHLDLLDDLGVELTEARLEVAHEVAAGQLVGFGRPVSQQVLKKVAHRWQALPWGALTTQTGHRGAHAQTRLRVNERNMHMYEAREKVCRAYATPI
jgi:hypothetical protein